MRLPFDGNGGYRSKIDIMMWILIICVLGGLLGAYLLSKEETKEKGVGCLGFVMGFFGTFFQYILPLLVFIAIIKLIFF